MLCIIDSSVEYIVNITNLIFTLTYNWGFDAKD